MAILKKVASIFLRISISVLLLIFLFRQIKAQALFELIKNADKLLLLLSFLLTAFIYILCFFRWKMLVNAVGLNPALIRLISAFSGGVFFNLFLPSTIGGDVVRGLDLAIHTKKTSEVVATSILDRLSGFIGVVAITLPAVFLGWRLIQDRAIFLSVLLLVSVLVFILLIIFNSFSFFTINRLLRLLHAGGVRTLLENIHKEMFYFRKHKKIVWQSILLSLFMQFIGPLSGYLLVLAFGLKLNIVYFFILSPIIGAISLLPITLGGLGIRDMATIYFFSKVGIGKDMAFTMSLLGFTFIAIFSFIGGVIYVFTLRHRRV